jgi:hypothetical protein
MPTNVITLNPADDLARRLEQAAGQPIIIEVNSVRYRIEPEDPFAFYDPEKMRDAIRASAGAWRGIVDAEELKAAIREARGHGPGTDEEHRAYFCRIVREAKPEPLPTEYGPETRYGRDSYSNGRYNDALDEYEAALLERIDVET